MILTHPFPTPAAVVEFFNAPANAGLRLVSVLPATNAPGLTALYETRPDSAAGLEAERLRLLEERILTLWQLDDDRKRAMNFPESVIDAPAVPLSIISNKLARLVLFRDMSNAERAGWIRRNLAAVGCASVLPDEARTDYGCAAELARIEA